MEKSKRIRAGLISAACAIVLTTTQMATVNAKAAEGPGPGTENIETINDDDIQAQEATISYHKEEILKLLNEIRLNNGLSALVPDPRMQDATSTRARELRESFSHTRPNGQPWYTANDSLFWGEILAKGVPSPQITVNAWMESEQHKIQILNGAYKTISIAAEMGDDGKVYTAIDFGIYLPESE